jgi:hypothetical protein
MSQKIKCVAVGKDNKRFAFYDLKFEDFHNFSGRCVFISQADFIQHLIHDQRCRCVVNGSFDIDLFVEAHQRFVPLLEKWEIKVGRRQVIERG